MPLVGFEPQSQSSFPDRLQRYWEHPHPYGLIAMFKSALNSMDDAVNGSIAATGVPPSTEEEAYRFNQARDRGIVGAFNAASKFGPGAPTAVAGALARYGVNGPSLVAREARSARVADGRRAIGNQGGVLLRPSGEYPIGPYVGPSLGREPPPTSSYYDVPPGGLLGRIIDLDALKRGFREANSADPVSGADPNFRKLTRVEVRPQESGISVGDRDQQAIAPESEGQTIDTSNSIPGFPEWLARRSKSTKYPRSGYGNGGRRGGGGSGGGGRGGNGAGDDDPCGTQGAAEQGECWDRLDDYVHQDYLWGCIERAKAREQWCRKPDGKPDGRRLMKKLGATTVDRRRLYVWTWVEVSNDFCTRPFTKKNECDQRWQDVESSHQHYHYVESDQTLG